MQSPLKILFLDDHAGLRNGIGFLISERNPALSFSYAGSADEAADVLKQNPDIALCILDLNLAGSDGLSALSLLRSVKKELPAIVYTMFSDGAHIEAALAAGVQGYVTKDADDAELENAILTVAGGNNFYNRASSKIMQSLIAGDGEGKDKMEPSYIEYRLLSKSEKKIFLLLAEKKEPEEIAALLGKSVKTVLNQRTIIYRKLGLRDRLDLIDFAKKIGVLV